MFCGKLHQNLSSCRPADCYLFQDDEYSFTLASSHRQTVSISPGKNSSRLSSGGSVQSSLGSGQLSDRSSPCCSSRVVLSHWSTSVQILCSHWWTPYYAGTKVYAITTHLMRLSVCCYGMISGQCIRELASARSKYWTIGSSTLCSCRNMRFPDVLCIMY